jgi:carnosine N-methyltransferase
MANFEVDEEEQHWISVCNAFLCYEKFVGPSLDRRQLHLNKIPDRYAARLPESTYSKFTAIANAAAENQVFFADMVHFYLDGMYDPASVERKLAASKASFSQHHRNQAVLHSLYREWSSAGMMERNMAFAPILKELQRCLPVVPEELFKLRVLAPGCGTGRLPIEIASIGYSCEGNEFSAYVDFSWSVCYEEMILTLQSCMLCRYMLMASNFVLNGIDVKESYTIFPWIEK